MERDKYHLLEGPEMIYGTKSWQNMQLLLCVFFVGNVEQSLGLRKSVLTFGLMAVTN
jgi:hypothetical protein